MLFYFESKNFPALENYGDDTFFRRLWYVKKSSFLNMDIMYQATVLLLILKQKFDFFHDLTITDSWRQ